MLERLTLSLIYGPRFASFATAARRLQRVLRETQEIRAQLRGN